MVNSKTAHWDDIPWNKGWLDIGQRTSWHSFTPFWSFRSSSQQWRSTILNDSETQYYNIYKGLHTDFLVEKHMCHWFCKSFGLFLFVNHHWLELRPNVFKPNAEIKGTESFKLVETTICYYRMTITKNTGNSAGPCNVHPACWFLLHTGQTRSETPESVAHVRSWVIHIDCSRKLQMSQGWKWNYIFPQAQRHRKPGLCLWSFRILAMTCEGLWCNSIALSWCSWTCANNRWVVKSLNQRLNPAFTCW